MRLQAQVLDRVSVRIEFDGTRAQLDAILRTIKNLSGVYSRPSNIPILDGRASPWVYHVPVRQANQEMFKQEFDAFISGLGDLISRGEFYICEACGCAMTPSGNLVFIKCLGCQVERRRKRR